MRAPDTNVLVRLLVRDDPEQVAGAEAFVEHGGSRPETTRVRGLGVCVTDDLTAWEGAADQQRPGMRSRLT